jgi:hypothetical protein
MKLINDSTIYKFMLKDKDSTLNAYRSEIVGGGMTVLNGELVVQLANIKKIYRDRLTQLAVDEVTKGNIIIYSAKNPTHCMPSYMPFIKYKVQDEQKVAIDITQYATVKKIKDSEELDVVMDTKKLYVFIISAYLYLRTFNRNTILPSKLAKSSAIVWAKLFCKILEMKVGLATNRERHDAFMYYAMMFFLVNIIESNEEAAKAIAKSYFKTGVVNSTIGYIETQIENRNLPIYATFEDFCKIMFDPEITGIRTMRLKNSNDRITLEYFVSQYITMYHVTSAFSRAAYPYFIWMVISACNWAYLFNDKTIEPIASEEYNTIMTELWKMV